MSISKEFEFKQVDKINNSNVYPLIAKAIGDISELADNRCIPVDWSHSAIWLERLGIPVSVIVYSLQEYNKVCWICISYTKPECRNTSLFKILYTQLQIIAKEKGMVKISGGIDLENKVMQRVAESVGRQVEYLVYTQELV